MPESQTKTCIGGYKKKKKIPAGSSGAWHSFGQKAVEVRVWLLYAHHPYIETVAQTGTFKDIVHRNTDHGVNTLDLFRNRRWKRSYRR